MSRRDPPSASCFPGLFSCRCLIKAHYLFCEHGFASQSLELTNTSSARHALSRCLPWGIPVSYGRHGRRCMHSAVQNVPSYRTRRGPHDDVVRALAKLVRDITKGAS